MGLGGDDDFGEFYRDNYPGLLAAVTSFCGSAERAREAADEACARALVSWSRVSTMKSPDGWLYRVAINVARRQATRHQREPAVLDKYAAGIPEAVIDTMPELELWQLVSTLPERQRLAITLRYVADMTEPEIADVMRVRRSTVSATLTKALRALALRRDSLAENDSPLDQPEGGNRA